MKVTLNSGRVANNQDTIIKRGGGGDNGLLSRSQAQQPRKET